MSQQLFVSIFINSHIPFHNKLPAIVITIPIYKYNSNTTHHWRPHIIRSRWQRWWNRFFFLRQRRLHIILRLRSDITAGPREIVIRVVRRATAALRLCHRPVWIWIRCRAVVDVHLGSRRSRPDIVRQGQARSRAQ